MEKLGLLSITKDEDTFEIHIFDDLGSLSNLNSFVGISKYLSSYFHLVFELPISR